MLPLFKLKGNKKTGQFLTPAFPKLTLRLCLRPGCRFSVENKSIPVSWSDPSVIIISGVVGCPFLSLCPVDKQQTSG